MASDIRPSVWDDSEPNYAPFRKKIRDHYCWVPSKKYRDAGYAIKTFRLEGTVGDGLDLERAAHCRALTRDMLTWYEGETQGRTPGSWGFLISRYRTDAYSGYHGVSAATREAYDYWLNRLEVAIGEVLVRDTNVAEMHAWLERMKEKGRSQHFIKNFFVHFGLIVSHGIKIEEPGCERVKAVRSAMRISNPAPRHVFATRAQIEAIVEEADRRGLPEVALACLFRFEFMLRGVDVYGQWERDEGREGGIRHHGRIWTTGLTWEMFDKDLTQFSKVINKTKKRMPEPYTFDLTSVPEIRRRLLEVEKRVGPVIVDKTGRPPARHRITKAFKSIVRHLGLPEDLRIADARSGGATEAGTMTDPMTLRDAMQHSQLSTTNLYVRGRSDGANRVVKLRQNARGTGTGNA